MPLFVSLFAGPLLALSIPSRPSIPRPISAAARRTIRPLQGKPQPEPAVPDSTRPGPRPCRIRALFRPNALHQVAFHPCGGLPRWRRRRYGGHHSSRIHKSALALLAARFQMGSHRLLGSPIQAPQSKQFPILFHVSAVHAHSIMTFPESRIASRNFDKPSRIRVSTVPNDCPNLSDNS